MRHLANGIQLLEMGLVAAIVISLVLTSCGGGGGETRGQKAFKGAHHDLHHPKRSRPGTGWNVDE